MACLQQVYRYRYLVLLWSVLELFCFSAVIYGWVSLVVVLKQEHYFYNLCDTNNSTISSGCIEQDRQLNLVFTVSVFTFSICGLLSGPIFDRFGPRNTRCFSCFLFGLSFLFFGLSTKDRANLLFPGIITLASAGQTMFLTVVQVANIFETRRSSVISLFSGALDSSAIVLLLMKLAYDGGVELNWIYIFYFLFAIISILCFTFILPPYFISFERLNSLVKTSSIPKIPYDLRITPNGSPLISKKWGTNGTAGTDGITGTHEDNQVPDEEAADQQAPLYKEKGIDVIDKDPEVVVCTESKSLLKFIASPEFILLVICLSIYTLRLWFYVGNLNSYLEFMSDNDADVVSKYTNWFGLAQFAGFLFAPVVGFVMDWRPKSKSQQSDVGFVLGFSLTNTIALILNILVLVPMLKVQYVSFVIQVVLRAFLYATCCSFLFHKFPLMHYGKLLGLGMAIAAVVGCLEYALFTISENSLKKDPFWINVGFLLLCMVPFTLPVYLWVKEKKDEKNIDVSPTAL